MLFRSLDQARTVVDTTPGGGLITPPLQASHPQGKTFTFSLTDASNTFGVHPNGTLFVRTAGVMDVNSQAASALPFTVTDAVGKLTTAVVTITVTETNKAPVFGAGWYARSVNEGIASGTPVGDAVTATDVNRRDALSYAITACAPTLFASGGVCPFAVDSATGGLRVNAGLPGSAVLLADRNATFPAGAPFNYTLTLNATDNGTPQRWTITGRTTFGNAVSESFQRSSGGATWRDLAGPGTIKGKAPLPVTSRDSRRALEIVTAFYHSSETREEVQFPVGASHPKYGSWLPEEFR